MMGKGLLQGISKSGTVMALYTTQMDWSTKENSPKTSVTVLVFLNSTMSSYTQANGHANNCQVSAKSVTVLSSTKKRNKLHKGFKTTIQIICIATCSPNGYPTVASLWTIDSRAKARCTCKVVRSLLACLEMESLMDRVVCIERMDRLRTVFGGIMCLWKGIFFIIKS